MLWKWLFKLFTLNIYVVYSKEIYLFVCIATLSEIGYIWKDQSGNSSSTIACFMFLAVCIAIIVIALAQ